MIRQAKKKELQVKSGDDAFTCLMEGKINRLSAFGRLRWEFYRI